MKTRASTISTLAFVSSLAAGTVSTVSGGPYADSVFNYSPGGLTESPFGSGQFFSDPLKALGPPDPLASTTTPSADVVQLGQRGSITLGFSQPILNKPANTYAQNPVGYDFTVFGNAFEQGFTGSGLFYREPGFVEVAQKLPSGQPGPFYLILPDKLPSQLTGGVDTGPGATLPPFYADVHPTDGAGNPLLAPDQPGSAGGDGFLLERAVQQSSPGVPLFDTSGNPQFVNLASVDFVRITDALPDDGGITGGYTTDIDAVVALPAPEPAILAILSVGTGFFLARRPRARR